MAKNKAKSNTPAAPAAPAAPKAHDPVAEMLGIDAKAGAARQEVRDKVTADQAEGQKSDTQLMEEAAARVAQSKKEELAATIERQKRREAAVKSGENAVEKALKVAKKVRVEAEATIASNQVRRLAVLETREENRRGVSPYKLSLEQQVVEDECNAELCDLNTIIHDAQETLGLRRRK